MSDERLGFRCLVSFGGFEAWRGLAWHRGQPRDHDGWNGMGVGWDIRQCSSGSCRSVVRIPLPHACVQAQLRLIAVANPNGSSQ